MKKYSKKKDLDSSLPNFKSEIDGFVAKLHFFTTAQKKELKKILELHFQTIAKYDVDMWQLKQRLDKSMQKVIVTLENGKNMTNASGSFDFLKNHIKIRKLNSNDSYYFAVVIHELTHCLSSSKQTFKNLPKFKSGTASTGFMTYYSESIENQSSYFAYPTNCGVYTEAITEYLTLYTISNYYGSVVPSAYIQEQKILNQLKVILGPKVIKAYFDNDCDVFDDLFVVDKTNPVYKQKQELQHKVFNYLENIDFVFNTQYSKLEHGDALYQNDFLNINLQHLHLFQIKVFTDLFKNMEIFQNGMAVKKAILNAFTAYASNVFMGNSIPNGRFVYDFWNDYFDTVVDTINNAREMFESIGLNIPSISDAEMLEYVFYAQCLCFDNYAHLVPITKEINVVDMQDFKIHKYLPKTFELKTDALKQLKNAIFSDLTKEYFDEKEVEGITCYDEVDAAMEELEKLAVCEDNKEAQRYINHHKKINQTFEK